LVAVNSAVAISSLENRLRKNARHLGRWAKREGLEAWRVYDRDVPEFPYAVDRYGGWLHVQLFDGKRELDDAQIAQHLGAIADALEVTPAQVAFKLRRRQRGQAQYEKLAEGGPSFIVRERGLAFEVNLSRYLDTGLFLDHRETRRRVGFAAAGKRVLNLFAYTGSFSVYAAAGGAQQTVTVDMSRTYQDWSRRNLDLNGFSDRRQHRMVTADVLAWLNQAQNVAETFDVIVLDPPSFSNSKRMALSFDVQRDHVELIGQATRLLAPGGSVYFSTNRRGFRLGNEVVERWTVEDISAHTLSQDFSRHRPHRCWVIGAHRH
jgi:23S rRNA (cytosine1962-C5)-methyltransferase